MSIIFPTYSEKKALSKSKQKRFCIWQIVINCERKRMRKLALSDEILLSVDNLFFHCCGCNSHFFWFFSHSFFLLFSFLPSLAKHLTIFQLYIVRFSLRIRSFMKIFDKISNKWHINPVRWMSIQRNIFIEYLHI